MTEIRISTLSCNVIMTISSSMIASSKSKWLKIVVEPKFNFIEANARNAFGGKKLGPKVHGKQGSLKPPPG